MIPLFPPVDDILLIKPCHTTHCKLKETHAKGRCLQGALEFPAALFLSHLVNCYLVGFIVKE